MEDRLHTEAADAWVHQRTEELAARLLPVLVACVNDLRVAIDHTLSCHAEDAREAFLAFGDYEGLARDAGICLALVARGVGAEVAESRVEPDALRALGRFVEEAFLRTGTLLRPGPDVLPRTIDPRPDRARDLVLLVGSLLVRVGEACPPGAPLRWRFHAGRHEDRFEIQASHALGPLEPVELAAWGRRLPSVSVETRADRHRIRVPRGRLAVTRAGLSGRA